jgi:hypothetical protein
MGIQDSLARTVTPVSEALQLTATIREELMMLRDRLNSVIAVPMEVAGLSKEPSPKEAPSPLIMELQDIIRVVQNLRVDVRL